MDIDNDGGKVLDHFEGKIKSYDHGKEDFTVKKIQNEWSDEYYGNKNLSSLTEREVGVVVVGYLRTNDAANQALVNFYRGANIGWTPEICKHLSTAICDVAQDKAIFKGFDWYKEKKKIYGEGKVGHRKEGAMVVKDEDRPITRFNREQSVAERHKLFGLEWMEWFVLSTDKPNHYGIAVALWAGYDITEDMNTNYSSCGGNIAVDGTTCIVILNEKGEKVECREFGKEHGLVFEDVYIWDPDQTYQDPVRYLDSHTLKDSPGVDGKPAVFELHPGYQIWLDKPAGSLVEWTGGYDSDFIVRADGDEFLQE